MRILVASAILCFIVLGATAALRAHASELPAADAARLDTALSEIVKQGRITGVAIGVVIDDTLVFSRGYGVAELGSKQPITPQTVFHWASVSKPLVAVAIMQLREAGQLNLDERITQYLPYFKMADPRYKDITIRELLLHTSGIPDIGDAKNYEWDRPQTDAGALERWVRLMADKSLDFAPGSQVRYSNQGYEVLGAVIAQVSGVSFEEYMQAHLFRPLKMTNSSFLLSDINPNLRVKGHVGDNPRQVSSIYPYNRRHAPSSTLNSDIDDMARFVGALINCGHLGDERLLHVDSLDTMWKPERTTTVDPFEARALGWAVTKSSNGRLMVQHGGGDTGFRSYLALIPQSRVGVFVVSNDEASTNGKNFEAFPLIRMVNTALEIAQKAQPRDMQCHTE